MDVTRPRDGSPCPIGFIGDLHDPWIGAIAEAVATGRRVHRANCPGPLPDRPFGDAPLPRAIIIHRNQLSGVDAQRLESWRAGSGPSPQIVLCTSPYVRYEELERWSTLVDLVVSEAVADDVLPVRLARRLDGLTRTGPPASQPGCRIEAAGGTGELCRSLTDASARAGYPSRAVDDHEIGGPSGWERDHRSADGRRVLTIWEVPVLEPEWDRRLEWRARRTGPVIALVGFADRAVVTRARGAGAVACLELPCDLDDLIDVVDRVVAATSPDSWPIPARAEPPHRLPPPRRNPRRPRLLAAPRRWPDPAPSPTIPPSGQ